VDPLHLEPALGYIKYSNLGREDGSVGQLQGVVFKEI